MSTYNFGSEEFRSMASLRIDQVVEFLESKGFEVVSETEETQSYASPDFPDIVIRIGEYADNMMVYASMIASEPSIRNSRHTLHINDIMVTDAGAVLYMTEPLEEISEQAAEATSIYGLRHYYPKLNRPLDRHYSDFCNTLDKIFKNCVNTGEDWRDMLDLEDNINCNVFLRKGKGHECLVLGDPLSGDFTQASVQVINKNVDAMVALWPSLDAEKLRKAMDVAIEANMTANSETEMLL